MKISPSITFICLLFPGALNAADDPLLATQRALKDRGFYSGILDGRVNAETRAGLKRFQMHTGLKITGETDIATLEALASKPPVDSEDTSNYVPDSRITESMRERARNLEKDDREFLSRFVEAAKSGETELSNRPLPAETPPPSAVAKSVLPSATRRQRLPLLIPS